MQFHYATLDPRTFDTIITNERTQVTAPGVENAMPCRQWDNVSAHRATVKNLPARRIESMAPRVEP